MHTSDKAISECLHSFRLAPQLCLGFGRPAAVDRVDGICWAAARKLLGSRRCDKQLVITAIVAPYLHGLGSCRCLQAQAHQSIRCSSGLNGQHIVY